jgi:hypothetical protein
MKTLKAVLAILILTVVPVAADDLGANLLSGEPVDTWAGITSNTAEIFGFYTARSRDYPNANQNTGDWSTTRTQWFEEGDTDTTQTLYRTRIHNWLQITNYTSRTLYISFNATYQSLLSGGTSHVVNETTPTLNTTTYQFRLDAAVGVVYPYMQIEADAYPDLFPLENVGIYAYDPDTDYFTSATFQSEVTSTTLVLRGR